MGTTAGLLQHAVFHMSLVRNSEVSVCVCVCARACAYGKTLNVRINPLLCRSDRLTSQKRKPTETITFIV